MQVHLNSSASPSMRCFEEVDQRPRKMQKILVSDQEFDLDTLDEQALLDMLICDSSPFLSLNISPRSDCVSIQRAQSLSMSTTTLPVPKRYAPNKEVKKQCGEEMFSMSASERSEYSYHRALFNRAIGSEAYI